MCFNNDDYDWTASCYFDDVMKAERDRRCQECGGTIKAGEYFREIEMWEHEECQRDECQKGCCCDDADFGEQFCTRRCLSCDQMLKAIEAAEIEEGCTGDETRPPLEQMFEGIQYADDRQRYFDKARELFPILATNGYLTVEQFKRASKAAKKPKKAKGEYKLSSLEAKFLECIAGLPQPEREHRFHPVRKWRLDFVWVDIKLAVEIDGGAFNAGRHNRAIPQAADCEKTNAAILLGWRVLKFNTVNMKHPAIVREVVERALGS